MNLESAIKRCKGFWTAFGTEGRKTSTLVPVVFLLLIPALTAASAEAQVTPARTATASSYVDRGHTWAKKGEWDRAVDDFNLALDFNPDYADAYYNRGVARSKQGEFDLALKDFDRAIQLQAGSIRSLPTPPLLRRPAARRCRLRGGS